MRCIAHSHNPSVCFILAYEVYTGMVKSDYTKINVYRLKKPLDIVSYKSVHLVHGIYIGIINRMVYTVYTLVYNTIQSGGAPPMKWYNFFFMMWYILLTIRWTGGIFQVVQFTLGGSLQL